MSAAVHILGTGAALPAGEVDTGTLVARAIPGRDTPELRSRIGIRTRRWLGRDESVAELGARALREALDCAGVEPSRLGRVIVATTTGGDEKIPTLANALLGKLEIDDTCDGFDVYNACTAFLTGLDLGARSVATGVGPVAVVAVEAFSRALLPSSPRAYLVLGDAAAAVVLGAGEGRGLGPAYLANTARLRGQMIQPHLHEMAAPTYVFDTQGDELLDSALWHIRRACDRALATAGLGWDDVDWFLPHQPNGHMLAALLRALDVSPARTVPVVDEIGSVGAAAVPFSLHRLATSGQLRAGQRVLMAAVGSGTAYGAAVYEVP